MHISKRGVVVHVALMLIHILSATFTCIKKKN